MDPDVSRCIHAQKMEDALSVAEKVNPEIWQHTAVGSRKIFI